MTDHASSQQWFHARLLLLFCFISPMPVIASGPAVVAIVNGRTITEQDVDASIVAKLQPLQQQIYALRKSALENFIARALLEDEAKRKGISVEQLRRDLTAGAIRVDATEIDRAYAENVSAFASMSPDEIRERLRLDLESSARMRNYRAEMTRLRYQARVEIFLDEPRLPSNAIAGGGPFRGAQDAPVMITEYSDFQCPYCKAAQAGLERLLEQHPKDVKLVFKHLPLESHQAAFPAARAAVCAAEQGMFWPFHDALFASDALYATTLEQIAATVPMDRSKYEACLSAPQSQAKVVADIQEAKHLGITATPGFVINGRVIRGSMTFEELQEIVDRELHTRSTQSSLSSR